MKYHEDGEEGNRSFYIWNIVDRLLNAVNVNEVDSLDISIRY